MWTNRVEPAQSREQIANALPGIDLTCRPTRTCRQEPARELVGPPREATPCARPVLGRQLGTEPPHEVVEQVELLDLTRRPPEPAGGRAGGRVVDELVEVLDQQGAVPLELARPVVDAADDSGFAGDAVPRGRRHQRPVDDQWCITEQIDHGIATELQRLETEQRSNGAA